MAGNLGVDRVVLYDLKTEKGGECWSPNVWRVRLTLNFKQIPYQTEWLEYPDIGPKGREIGAPPTIHNPDGSGDMLWTVPMLLDPNNLDDDGKPTVLSDSNNIVEYLDRVYTVNKVIPQGTTALIAAWEQFIRNNILGKLAWPVIVLCPKVLAPRSKEYFIQTREKWWGPLDKRCPDRKKALEEAREGFTKVAAALDSDSSAQDTLTVIPGQISYADFLMLGPVLWATAILESEEVAALRSWNDNKWGRIMDMYRDRGLLRVD